MKRQTVSGQSGTRPGFTLAEVVIALGIITVGVVAVLGVFPAALQTGHSAQDETRAAHMAQSIFGSLVAQAPSQFTGVRIPVSGGVSPPINLATGSGPAPALTLYADNDGRLLSNSTNATYAIYIYTNNSVAGFTDPASANAVTVRVLWPPIPGQGPTPAPNQTFRDYVRIVSKF
jgi:prepilin-type N-terminal cleavage/methylation domain-containing protein